MPRTGNCFFFFCNSFLQLHIPAIVEMTNKMQLLTKREKEVVQLLSLGLTYIKIAQKINVSHETVKMHLKNIYRKLDVQNKIEALKKVQLL